MRWTYSIDAPGSWESCTTCPDNRLVTVREPDGSQTLHTFGNRWRVNEGQLLRVDEGWNGSTALRTTSYRYRDRTFPQAFVEQFGLSPLPNNDWLSSRHRPLDQRVTRVQGTAFTWEAGEKHNPAAGFDALVRPVLVRKFSSLSDSRTEQTQYHDNNVHWVLGQVKRLTEQTTGREVESHVYHLTTAQLMSSASFGKTKSSYTYHPDGTIWTVNDEGGRPTTLLNRAGRANLNTA